MPGKILLQPVRAMGRCVAGKVPARGSNNGSHSHRHRCRQGRRHEDAEDSWRKDLQGAPLAGLMTHAQSLKQHTQS